MASGGGFSYKPNVNRNVTKKWRDAARPTYDDDDEWGDDGYGTYNEPPPPVPAPAQRPGWGGQMPPPNRSFTNPSPPRSTGRQSFDHGDDRRYVSMGGGFGESPYPSTQRPPFPEPQHDEAQQQRFYAQHPVLNVNTQGQGPYPPAFRPSSRGQNHGEAPFSAPGSYQRSHSGSRSSPGPAPVPGGFQPRQGSPARPDSRSSNTSGRFHPPRKSSLSQEQPPPLPQTAPNVESEESPATTQAAPAKPLPFIRPADIYKRFEEQKEKERRSMDSQRPSLELDTTRSRDSSTSAKTATSDNKETAHEDSDSARRLKPTLDTVVERKSEYGFDNLIKGADSTHPSQQRAQQGDGVHRQDTNASSVYTDRPDPVSASTADEDHHSAEPSSAFSFQSSLPALGRQSVFDPELTPAPTQSKSVLPTPTAAEQTSSTSAANKSIDKPDTSNLDHKPSFGYRSVVQQAFDDSQNRRPASPTSTSETLPRSNSASTSELSPIISRKPDQFNGQSQPNVTEQPIPEEPSSGTSNRPLSESTIKGQQGVLPDSSMPGSTVIQPGYRRDVTSPSRGANSPARQADIRTSTEMQPQQGVLTTAQSQDADRGRPRQPSGDTLTSPGSASQASGVSEEYKQWQAQSNQFNTRLDLDGTPATPAINSAIARAESPPKGTVRGLTGKYENNNSGRSTPVSVAPTDTSTKEARPAPHERLESFRPSLPGGWQSYSGTPGVETPPTEQARPPPMLGQQSYDSTDSIPTAKAPQGWRQGPANAAFAAAAAAGTALAGSFNGPALTDRRPENSDDESENEWDQSSTSSHAEATRSDTRDFAATQPQPPTTSRSVPQRPESSNHSYHSYDTTPSDVGNQTPADTEAAAANTDYFPAPLRTSKIIDPGTTPRPPVPNVRPLGESPIHSNNEELQQEIVKSLTPRSSNFEGQPSEEAVSKPLPMSPAVDKQPSTTLDARESEDMYGGGSGQRSPVSTAIPQLRSSPGHQPQYSASSMGSGPPRPFLEQRFSWETDPKVPDPTAGVSSTARTGSSTPPTVASPAAESPETIKAFESTARDASGTSSSIPTAAPRSDAYGTHTTDQPIQALGASSLGTDEPITQPLPAATAASPTDFKSFREIMNISDQDDRIKAFEDNRIAYGRSDGMLDQWIHSLEEVPEHANIFQSNGRMWKDTGASYNTSRLPSNRPMASITGSKIVQEDGKRLMAAAGRFGGKAGVAAKGLFAKGKDKLRSASTSDKSPQSKRRSGGLSSSTIAEESESKRNFTFLNAPQIPAQDLHSSPIEGNAWFGSDPDETAESSTGEHPVAAKQSKTSMNDRARHTDRNVAGPITAQQESTMRNQPAGDRKDSIEPMPAGTVPVVQVPSGSGDEPKNPTDEDTTPTTDNQAAPTKAANENLRERPVSDLTDNGSVGEGQTQLQPSQALAATDDRRHSSVSAVSSASPGPADGSQPDLAHRSISPAGNEKLHDERAPDYEETAPDATGVSKSFTKDEEAAQERAAVEDQNDPVPSYEETPAHSGQQQRIGPGAKIVPVANLTEQRRTEPVAVSNRPFSFEGSGDFQNVQDAYERSQQNGNAPSHPMSPVGQPASKDLSQVSVDDVHQEQVPKQNRQSKSYSRPFGADLLGEHPAFRPSDQPVDRSQMYSSEAPLRNVQNPEDEAVRCQQQKALAEEGGYRIPGPYHQEFRSPKPRQRGTSSPTAAYIRQPSSPPSRDGLPTGAQPQASPQTQFVPQHPSNMQQHQQDGAWPGAASAQPKVKKTPFGAFLFGKSKPTPAPAQTQHRGRSDYVDPEKRPNLYTTDSRQDSIVSGQSSLSESRDVVGQLPPLDKSKRRMSRDLLKKGSPASTAEKPQDGKKKKRFSAMGNLFSRSDKSEKTQPPQRSTTLPSNSAQPDRGQYLQSQQQFQNSRYHDPRYPQDQFSGSPPPAGGYYGSPQHQEQDYVNYNPSFRSQGSYSQHGYPVNSPQGYESRPSDLRIDTSGQGRHIGHDPATAPPQPTNARNNSHQNTGTYSSANTHSNTGSYLPPTTRAPIFAAAGQSGIDPHVVSLHKRSRSPTMDRHNTSPEHDERVSDNLAPPTSNRGSGGTPVEGLGTFSNKRISPVGGIPRSSEEQEAPFKIGIPGEEDQRRRTRQLMIEQGRFRDLNSAQAAGPASPSGLAGAGASQGGDQRTVAERMMNPGGVHDKAPNAASAARAPMSRHGAGTRESSVKQAPGSVAELPGSKADGYESEEEITMSATVRPGDWDWQMPVFVDDTK